MKRYKVVLEVDEHYKGMILNNGNYEVQRITEAMDNEKAGKSAINNFLEQYSNDVRNAMCVSIKSIDEVV